MKLVRKDKFWFVKAHFFGMFSALFSMIYRKFSEKGTKLGKILLKIAIFTVFWYVTTYQFDVISEKR